jgi:DHA2 family lincomycin resistance protein-like MFS transporter
MDLFAVSGNRSPCKAGEGAEGWTSPLVTGSILVGFVSLVLFALRRSFMRKPVMDLRVFRDPMYIMGLLLVLSCIMIILSSMIILPMFLQNGMGLSVFTAGRMLLPGSALNGILSPRMGRLFDKYRPKCLVIPGLIVVAVVLCFSPAFRPHHHSTCCGRYVTLSFLSAARRLLFFVSG